MDKRKERAREEGMREDAVERKGMEEGKGEERVG